MTAEFILVTFDDTDGAQQALDAVRAVESSRCLWLDEIAVVERHASGRIATHTIHGSVTQGSAWGGLTGGLIGLLFGPAGFLAGLLIGGGGGAVIEKVAKESGLPAGFLSQVRRGLARETSALALIGETTDVGEMAQAFVPHHPVSVVREELSDQIVEQLRAGTTDTDQTDQTRADG